jgi:hypothetical protein
MPLVGTTIFRRVVHKTQKLLGLQFPIVMESDAKISRHLWVTEHAKCPCPPPLEFDPPDEAPLVDFAPKVIIRLSAGVLARSDPSLKQEAPVVSTCSYLDFQSDALFVDADLYESGDPTTQISYITNRDRQLNYCDPLTGTPMNVNVTWRQVSNLAPFTPLNYTTLPWHVLNYYASGYAELVRQESLTYLYHKFLSTPSIPVHRTIAAFNVGTPQLVEDILGLILQLEPIQFSLLTLNESPINFEVNVMTGDAPRLSSLQHLHSALRNLLGYIEESGLAQKVAAEWFKIMTTRFRNPGAHSVVCGHPTAVVRSFHRISSPFVFSRRDVPAWIITHADYQGRQFTIGDAPFERGIYYHTSNSFTIHFTQTRGGFAAIPVCDSLAGTFFSLVLLLKYFTYFVAGRSWPQLADYRRGIYTVTAESLIAGSPFFIQFPAVVLTFLRARLPLGSSDLSKNFIRTLNLLAIYRLTLPSVHGFLEELEILFEERSLVQMGAAFPEFLTPQDAEMAASLPPAPWDVPRPWIPRSLDKNSSEIRECISKIKRLFAPRETLVGFPFHLLLRLWLEAVHMAPPFERRPSPRGAHCIEIDFTLHRPRVARLFIQNGSNLCASLDGSPITGDFAVPPGPFTLELPTTESWAALQFALLSDPPAPHVGHDFVVAHSRRFTDDIRAWQTVLSAEVDQDILRAVGTRAFDCEEFSFSVSPTPLVRSSLSGVPLHIRLMRTPPLVLLNWLASARLLNIANDPSLAFLLEHTSATTQVAAFLEDVARQSSQDSSRSTQLHVDRAAAFNVRSGSSTSLSDTVIAQMTRQYDDPRRFRRCAADPWTVSFTGERGVDVGGPARELVAECAIDLCSPSCGLVVQVPNARNDVGEGREYVLPIPNPRHQHIPEQYRFAGALIAIAIRSGLVQDFPFPPLVWEYLAQEKLTIERVFEVDQNYRLLIQSLQDALRGGLSDAEFSTRFHLRFVVVDSTGEERSLTQRGRFENVTLENVGSFISLANEYRLNELRTWLEYMRRGMWENLNMPEVKGIDWRVLEYAACGEKDVPLDVLKKVTNIRVSAQRGALFWRVVEALTPEERGALLKFSTGRSRLPPDLNQTFYLVVDDGLGTDTCPRSSTCFFQLHWPMYSSFSKALQMTRIAISFSGSFENA